MDAKDNSLSYVFV